jgi:hypothetical protein
MLRIEIVGFFVVASVVAAMATPIWNPADGVIFPPAKANSLFSQQCSRDRPNGITGYWLPQAEQVAELEKRLPGFLDKEVHRIVNTSDPRGPQMPNYLRQYAGLVEGGRKIIYVNGFLADRFSSGDGLERKADWRTHAFSTCDGYINYFGVEYDPETRDFAHLVFNGIG